MSDDIKNKPEGPAGAREFEQHTKAVGEFLNEMYATMVDPCEQPQMTVAEMCNLLIKTAREHREIANNYAQQTAAKDAEIEQLQSKMAKDDALLGKVAKSREAAERERDDFFRKLTQIEQIAANDGHIKLLSIWRIANAALKAGKDGQQ